MIGRGRVEVAVLSVVSSSNWVRFIHYIETRMKAVKSAVPFSPGMMFRRNSVIWMISGIWKMDAVFVIVLRYSKYFQSSYVYAFLILSVFYWCSIDCDSCRGHCMLIVLTVAFQARSLFQVTCSSQQNLQLIEYKKKSRNKCALINTHIIDIMLHKHNCCKCSVSDSSLFAGLVLI